MIMATTGILTVLIPLLTKGAESLLKSRQEKQEQAYELEKMRLEAGILADKEISKAQAEARKAEAEAERERLKTLSVMHKTGAGKMGTAINLIRALFGYSAVLIFAASAVNLWNTGSPLLTQAEFAETFSAVLFYYFAERSAKKAFGRD